LTISSEWTNVVFTVDVTNLAFFVDGNEDTNATGSLPEAIVDLDGRKHYIGIGYTGFIWSF
jgi:hypothetical protein